MKNLLLLFGVCTIALFSQTNVQAQNIFSGERVQVVGTFNSFSTVPYGSDYRTTTFRRVSVSSGNPTDGRGQWATTFNVQSSGGDVTPINMTGGGAGGFLFISGPQSPGNPFQNKWAFSGIGSGAVNAINGISAYNSGNDMGLNMSTAGRYTFVFNDCGYTQTNARYYVGYTANAPVTVSRTGQTFSGGQAVVSITTSATPSAGENVYVRYRVTNNDFTTGTSVVQATGSGTSWSAAIPSLTCGATYYYYVYTSTRSISQINGDSETDRSLATLRYDDNSGSNYSFTVSPVPTAGITNNTGSALLTCAVTSISVTATGGDTYAWDNGLGSGASKNITAPGTYTVTATAANGCTDQESIVITQDIATPNAGITNNSGTTILTCAAPSISVTATGGSSYSWDNGLGNSAAASITAPGTYTVTVVADNGCSDQESIVITQDLSENTFSGTGDWTDGTKWSCGTPPGSGSIITIAAGANVTLNTDFTVAGSLVMTATSTLTVNPTRTLTVSGSANFAGQSVTFKSDNTGTASLGQVTGSVTGATNVTVERYIPNNNFRSWRLLSVPVTTSQSIRQAWQEGDVNPLPKQNNAPGYGTQITGVYNTQAAAAAAGFDSTSVQAAMLRWNGAGWSNITSTTQPINNFSSYFLYIRGDRSLSVTGMTSSSNATTLRTKGTIFTGNVVNNVGAGAFALIPNRYPSAINFTGLTRDAGISNLFYIWDSKKLNGSSLGIYQTFSNTNSFNCLISGGSYTLGQPNTTIESGQSFFVQGTSGGNLTLVESAKISGGGSLGFRPTPSAVKSAINSRLYNSNDEMLDANTVVFDAVYSKAVADEDAPKMGNPGANFAIETGSKLLAIEGTTAVKEGDAIQFRMWNMEAGNYKLEFAMSNLSLPAGTEAILEDSYSKTNTVLNTSAATSVNFTVDASTASSAANRFRIVIGKAANLNKAGFTIAPNPVEGNTMNVVFSQQAAGKYSVRIVSANGQAVSTYRLTHAGGNGNQVISLPAVMGNGTYTVEIVSPDKARTVKTVLVNRN